MEVEVLVAPNTPPAKRVVGTTVLCNCWLYVQSVYPSLPSTKGVLSALTATGSVAVFYYPKVGIHHYAVVIGTTDDGYYIEETNYDACEKGTRVIPKDDPNLIGFYTP